MTKSTKAAPIIAAILLLLPLLYVGSYFALVVPTGKPTNRVFRKNGQTIVETYLGHYRLGGDASEHIFWPLEQIDRCSRPRAWEFVPDGVMVE